MDSVPGAATNVDDTEHSDHALLTRFRNGDDEAATLLYERYARRLKAIAQANCSRDLSARVEAEDIVQSVFRSFFRRTAGGEYQIPEGSELWKLLLVITLNKVRATGQFHRAARRDVRQTASADMATSAAIQQKAVDEQAFAELKLLVADLLRDLPESQQQMVRLRMEGHGFHEIAEITGRSKRTIERVLQQFRESLREMLDRD